MSEITWNPKQPNIRVRMRNNPGKQGVTTGETLESAGRLLVQVDFGTNEINFRKFEQLEPIEDQESLIGMIEKGKYGSLADLRRVITFEKVKGQLTNIFYSMESSNTDFYPHQFKPVLKFLYSPVGRLLIADEVGLGKTIEAILIWKELQARQNAHRLLILCPAVLREKWKGDLQTKFNIDAEIVNAQKLYEKIRNSDRSATFAYIASIEGLRPRKNWDDIEKHDIRSQLARFLDLNPSTDEFSIFDLAVIDEAHYLKNSETSNNQLGGLVRDASRHFLLLTATPIQIGNENLFQLLKLISPEDFEYQQTFEQMLKANKPIVAALKELSNQEINLQRVDELLNEAQESEYFVSNSRIQQIRSEIISCKSIKIDKLIEWKRNLENCSLLGQFMTRSNKKDVLENQVKRSPMALNISFSSLEQSIYMAISQQIRKLSANQQGIGFFSLVLRQRQMASCLVAALRAWKQQNILHRFIEDDSDIFVNDLWENFGIEIDEQELDECEFIPVNTSSFSDADIKQLEKEDSKYNKLIKLLKKELSKNPNEKFVLFSYFKGTLNYLSDRMTKDGISTCLMHGDVLKGKNNKFKDKNDILKMFKDTKVSILLSSEVGSEGIDLQFCRFLINYDLPWNPMRVEQRIGRIDRLGQKAERISIIHFKINNTVEERVLTKLYERINIFEESIGNLQDILGQETEHLIMDLLNPNLSEEEREEQANQTLRAIENKKAEQKLLESEAINLVAFSNYILDAISESREKGRWLRPEELDAFIDDFFQTSYPETSVVTKAGNKVDIDLSALARVDLRVFMEKRQLSTKTRLHLMPTTCLFDPKKVESFGNNRLEILDPIHPLIQWIRFEYEKKANESGSNHPFHSLSAIEVSQKDVECSEGVYIFVIQRWDLQGFRSDVRLACRAVNIDDLSTINENVMETILDKVIFHGRNKSNVFNLVEKHKVIAAYKKCEQELEIEFSQISEDFEIENDERCDVQLQNINAYRQRKESSISQRIEKFKAEGKTRIIHAFEGQLKKLEQDCQVNIKKLDQKRSLETRNPQLAAGILFVIGE